MATTTDESRYKLAENWVCCEAFSSLCHVSDPSLCYKLHKIKSTNRIEVMGNWVLGYVRFHLSHESFHFEMVEISIKHTENIQTERAFYDFIAAFIRCRMEIVVLQHLSSIIPLSSSHRTSTEKPHELQYGDKMIAFFAFAFAATQTTNIVWNYEFSLKR